MHTLSPARLLSDRKEALEFVFDPRHLDILKESLSPGLEVGAIEMNVTLPFIVLLATKTKYQDQKFPF